MPGRHSDLSVSTLAEQVTIVLKPLHALAAAGDTTIPILANGSMVKGQSCS
jgi:hypothetical protein